MRLSINHGSIEVLKGDIADQDTQAIVNAANNHFWMGGGVAGAIKRKGGEVIEEEAVALGPVEVGQAVITSAGALPSRHVIHAAVMGQDLHTDAPKVKAATRNALLLAEKHAIASLSLPALGTGVGGFSVYHCATIMLTEAIQFLMTSKNLRTIRFVLFDDATFKAFEEEMKLQFSAKRH
jgi:O-acetyl-ADP-ribose deacetylase (regulator of RNase III)